VRARAEFATVAQFRTAYAKIGDTDIVVGAVDPVALGTLFTPPITTGSLADLGPGTVVVATTRDRLGSSPVGTTLTVAGGAATSTVRVVATTPVLAPGVTAIDLLLPWSDFAALTGDAGDTAILVKKAPGVSAGAARSALDALTDTYPLTSVGSVAEVNDDLSSIVDRMLGLIAGLLAITVVISLFGITNTLALSVVERTRESATVRALGLTRGQLRATLLLEALLMAAVGALVGLAFGLVYGAVLVHKSALRALDPILVVPWGWFVGIVALVTVTAVLAAVLPARRAARAAIVAAMADT
jgi:putative ABC transport system permease protein